MNQRMISSEDALMSFMDEAVESCRAYHKSGHEFRYAEESVNNPVFCGMLAICAGLIRRSGMKAGTRAADPDVVMAMLLLSYCGVKMEDVVSGKFGATWLDNIALVATVAAPTPIEGEKPS